MEWNEIVALVSISVTVLLGLLQLRKIRSQADHEQASATKELVEAANILLIPYQKETERLRLRIIVLEDIIADLEEVIQSLKVTVDSL